MKINQRKVGVVLSYLTMFLGTAISIVYTPIMLGLLGKSQYGLYQLVASIVSYLGLLSFGFSGAYVRFYSRYKVKDDNDGIAKLNGMFFAFYLFVGIIALIAGLVLTTNINALMSASLTPDEIETARILMIVLVFNIAIAFPFSVFNSYITANEKYIFQKILEVTKTVTSPLITLPVLLMGYGSIGLVITSTALNILISLGNTFYCFTKLNFKISLRNFNFSLLKEVAIFSTFIFINIIVDQINWNVDKFLLGMYQGTSAVAVYSIAAQLNSYYLLFPLTISSVFLPKVNQLTFGDDADKNLNELFVRVGRIQFIVLALVLSGLYFFGKSFILLWIGTEYIESHLILLILITPASIPLIQTLGMEIQRAKNLHKFRAFLYLAIALSNILISIPLIKNYSGVGGAIGTAIALFIGNGLIMNYYYHKKCGIDILAFWKEISKFIPSVLCFCAVGLLGLHYITITGWFQLLLLIGAYASIFFIIMWFLGFNAYEKHLIINIFDTLKQNVARRRR